jgi:hypothetical protein
MLIKLNHHSDKVLFYKTNSNVCYTGAIEGGSEFFGGTRIMTFMVYFSKVQLGGHTVFPQAGKIGL